MGGFHKTPVSEPQYPTSNAPGRARCLRCFSKTLHSSELSGLFLSASLWIKCSPMGVVPSLVPVSFSVWLDEEVNGRDNEKGFRDDVSLFPAVCTSPWPWHIYRHDSSLSKISIKKIYRSGHNAERWSRSESMLSNLLMLRGWLVSPASRETGSHIQLMMTQQS